MRKMLFGLVMTAMAGTTLMQNAKTATAEATCDVRKDGDTISLSPVGHEKQIRRFDEIARDRTR